MFFVFAQTQWMVAQQTVMETESAWLDTATASLDSWVLTVPKVRDKGFDLYSAHRLQTQWKHQNQKRVNMSLNTFWPPYSVCDTQTQAHSLLLSLFFPQKGSVIYLFLLVLANVTQRKKPFWSTSRDFFSNNCGIFLYLSCRGFIYFKLAYTI